MSVHDGRLYQRRWQLGRTGEAINVEELAIDYVLGSGNRARSYLHRTPRGMLIELPLGWYSENGGEWAMTPGDDTPHPATRRFVSYKCMFCHNGYPEVPGASDVPGGDPVFPGKLPRGIDCQRCHGPGAEHVRTSGKAAVVNPAKLSPDRRMEVCMQCHLETTSGHIPATLQRFDRGAFSYIPGQPLGAFELAFDHAPGTGRDDKFEAVSSVYRLRQSRCFLESGKLECTTCHNPHRALRGSEALRTYSKACLECHASATHPAAIQATAADCISCHMPKRRAEDAPHVVMTDHRIQRRPPANALAPMDERPPEYRGEVVAYYPSPLPATPENELYRAVAQVGLDNNTVAGMPGLVKWIGEVKPREPEFYMILGEGWKSLGDLEKAAAAYRRALELAPASTRAMRALAAVDSSHAEEILARAVTMAPNDPESWFRFGVLTKSAERIQRAIALDPYLPDQYRRLAELTHSLSTLEDALRTDPFDAAAWDLGGRLMAEKGDAAEATFDFERAIQLNPQAPYLYDYALLLARTGKFDEAQKRAESSLGANPAQPDAHELLGGLYLRKNELPEAIREYRAALALAPSLPRLHLRLGTALAARGEKDEAAAQLREAANGGDADIARQAAEALRQLGIRP
jgi:tetratricopeptide (TPR) repeat protein